jgi:DNA-binding response OmpR family regulator
MSNEPKIVLLADDQIFMLRLLENTFRKDGYQLLQVQNGTDALAVATERKPHLIVMDVMMPGLDGLSVISQLKQNESTHDIPVIVLSSKAHAMTKLQAEQVGATIFMHKPFSPILLRAEARRILKSEKPANKE